MSKLHLLLAAACLASGPALAQDQTTFATMATERERNAPACPLAEYTHPAAMPPGTPPFFKFNGIYKDGNVAIPDFSCRSIGPFLLNGKTWYVQNVQGLIPPGKPRERKERTDSVRLCSVDAKIRKAKHDFMLYGPFGGEVGPGGCERLWKKDYAVP